MVAWDHFMKVNNELHTNEGYLYDLVDVTRQAIQILTDVYYDDLIRAFKRKYIDDFL